MNEPKLMSAQLLEVRERMEQLERRMDLASSKVHGLRRQAHVSRITGGASLISLLAVAVLSSLAAAPQRYQEPPTGQHTMMATFQILDEQENLIVQIAAEGTRNVFAVYPPGTSPRDPGTPALLASTPEGGPFFKALSPANSDVSAACGIVNGKDPAFVLRYGGSQPRLSMAVTSGKPDLNLSDAAGNVLVDLGEGGSGGDVGAGEGGGGALMLTNGSGGTIMQAGTTSTGVGTVTVFPQGRGGFLPTAPIAGGAFALKEANRLPGTFICGTGCAGH